MVVGARARRAGRDRRRALRIIRARATTTAAAAARPRRCRGGIGGGVGGVVGIGGVVLEAQQIEPQGALDAYVLGELLAEVVSLGRRATARQQRLDLLDLVGLDRDALLQLGRHIRRIHR